jgi:hypothetical protein
MHLLLDGRTVWLHSIGCQIAATKHLCCCGRWLTLWPPISLPPMLCSATTYSVVRTLAAASQALNKTCLISLLQPAPEVQFLA